MEKNKSEEPNEPSVPKGKRCGKGCPKSECLGTCGREKGHGSIGGLRMHKCWHCKHTWMGG